MDAHAAHLRGEDYTYQQIADEMGCSAPTADARVNRAYGRMAGPNALAAKNRQLRELQDLRMAVYAVLESQHVAVNVRGVVTIEINGQKVPLPDYHPVLEAVDRLLDIQAQEAKLIGTLRTLKTKRGGAHKGCAHADHGADDPRDGAARRGNLGAQSVTRPGAELLGNAFRTFD